MDFLKKEILEKYTIQDMCNWEQVGADLIITDPPFGIDFTGKNNNYNRDVSKVVDGYVEWDKSNYSTKIQQLLKCLGNNLVDKGQALIFSGWNNSNVIHNEINKFKGLTLQGKMYWVYNFAPFCKKRPAHNVYEMFWLTKTNDWYYRPECSTRHCVFNEANLSSMLFKKEYKKGMPKYPTRLPFQLVKCLLEHFSQKEDLIFDPLAGSGMVGIVAHLLGRDFLLGDLNKNGKQIFAELIEHYYKSGGVLKWKIAKEYVG